MTRRIGQAIRTAAALAAALWMASGACQATCPHGMAETRGGDGLKQYHCVVPAPAPAPTPAHMTV